MTTTIEDMPATKSTVLSWTRQHKTWTCIIIALICILLYQFWKRVVMKNIIIDRASYSPRHFPLPPDEQKAGKL